MSIDAVMPPSIGRAVVSCHGRALAEVLIGAWPSPRGSKEVEDVGTWSAHAAPRYGRRCCRRASPQRAGDAADAAAGGRRPAGGLRAGSGGCAGCSAAPAATPAPVDPMDAKMAALKQLGELHDFGHPDRRGIRGPEAEGPGQLTMHAHRRRSLAPAGFGPLWQLLDASWDDLQRVSRLLMGTANEMVLVPIEPSRLAMVRRPGPGCRQARTRCRQAGRATRPLTPINRRIGEGP